MAHGGDSKYPHNPPLKYPIYFFMFSQIGRQTVGIHMSLDLVIIVGPALNMDSISGF